MHISSKSSFVALIPSFNRPSAAFIALVACRRRRTKLHCRHRSNSLVLCAYKRAFIASFVTRSLSPIFSLFAVAFGLAFCAPPNSSNSPSTNRRPSNHSPVSLQSLPYRHHPLFTFLSNHLVKHVVLRLVSFLSLAAITHTHIQFENSFSLQAPPHLSSFHPPPLFHICSSSLALTNTNTYTKQP